jgi:hypothetical protein
MSGHGTSQAIEALWEDWTRLLYTCTALVLRPVWANKIVAVLTFMVVCGIFVAQAVRAGYTYSASATLLLSPPAYQELGPSSAFMPAPLDIPSYARLLIDPGVLQEVCARLLEEKPELWAKMDEADALVPDVLRRMVGVETQIIEKTPQAVRYSTAIALAAKAKTPDMAKHIVDAWAAVSVEKVRKLTEPGTELTIAFVRGEYDTAKEQLERREDALCKFQVENDIALIEMLADEYRTKLKDYQVELSTMDVDIAEAEQQLVQVQTQKAEEDEKKTLKRSLSNDAFSIVQGTGDGKAELPVFEDEILNSTWIRLRGEETSLASKLAGLNARKEMIQKEVARLEEEVQRLRAEVAVAKLEDERLSRHAAASKAYFDIVAKQQEDMAGLEASLKQQGASSIMVANAAVLPSRPGNAIQRWVRVPLGFAFGVAAALAVSNIVYELRRRRTPAKTG